jgi:uncharacterized membrane protein YqhA
MLMLATRCLMVPFYLGWRGGSADSVAAMFLQKLCAVIPKLIGSFAAITAVAMPESFAHTPCLAAATAMWQLAITPGFAVLATLLAAPDRRDKESSKEYTHAGRYPVLPRCRPGREVRP